MSTTLKSLIFFRSSEGERSTIEDWKPVLPKDVPDWVKNPDTVALITTGGIAFNAKRPQDDWWRAEEAPMVH